MREEDSDPVPRCASVISTTSVLGSFCRVIINSQPVIVPAEYLTRHRDGSVTCTMSGVHFPVTSCTEVALETGPPPSLPRRGSADLQSLSEFSLLIPSSASSSSSTTTSGLTLQDDRVYAVRAEGLVYSVRGAEIRKGAESAFQIRVDGRMVEVSDIEEGEEEESTTGLQPDLLYRVVFQGQQVSLPGSVFYRTDAPGKFIVRVAGQTGLVENPVVDQTSVTNVPSYPPNQQNSVIDQTSAVYSGSSQQVPAGTFSAILPHQQQNLAIEQRSASTSGIFPQSQVPTSNFPMVPPHQVNPVIKQRSGPPLGILKQAPVSIFPAVPPQKQVTTSPSGTEAGTATVTVVKMEQERRGSNSTAPKPSFDPVISRPIPSFTTQLMIDALERSEVPQSGFEVISCRESPLLSPSPARRSRSRTRSPSVRFSPKRDIIERFREKSVEVVLRAEPSPPRKPKFVSPASFLPMVIPPAVHPKQVFTDYTGARIRYEKGKKVTIVDSKSSSESLDLKELPPLPGLEVLADRALSIQNVHHGAFLPEVRVQGPTPSPPPRPTTPQEVVVGHELVQLGSLADLNARVQFEIETESRMEARKVELEETRSTPSSERDDFDRIARLSTLPGIEMLEASAISHMQNVDSTQRTDSPVSGRRYENLPGIEDLLQAMDHSTGARELLEETDTGLFNSFSLARVGPRHSRHATGSSTNTLQQIDDITSLNSSLQGSPCPNVPTSPALPELYRVLVEGAWHTARKEDLEERAPGEVYMTMIDKTVKRTQMVIKVPGVSSPTADTAVYLCDNKTYSVEHEKRTYRVPGSQINPDSNGTFRVEINGTEIVVRSSAISELPDRFVEFSGLRSMVAVRVEGVWRVVPAEQLVPSAQSVGQYQLKQNGRSVLLSPDEVFPMFRETVLPLGGNPVPERYVARLAGRQVKIPRDAFSASRSQPDAVILHHKSKKRTVKLTELVPYVESGALPPGPASPLSLTNTGSFSAPEFKDNLYRVQMGERTVNIPGRNIKPHKRRSGYCKVRYRGKVFRIQAECIVLVRQTATQLNRGSPEPASSAVPEPHRYRPDPAVELPPAVQVVEGSRPRVRFPQFSALLKGVPPEHSPSLVDVDLTLEKGLVARKSPGASGQTRVSVRNVKSARTVPPRRHRKPITLDVQTSGLTLRPPSNCSGGLQDIPENGQQFEITNFTSSPGPGGEQRKTCVVRPISTSPNRVVIGVKKKKKKEKGGGGGGGMLTVTGQISSGAVTVGETVQSEVVCSELKQEKIHDNVDR